MPGRARPDEIEWLPDDAAREPRAGAAVRNPRRARWWSVALVAVAAVLVAGGLLWPEPGPARDPLLLWPRILPDGAALVEIERAAPGSTLASPLPIERTVLARAGQPEDRVFVERLERPEPAPPPTGADPVDLGPGTMAWSTGGDVAVIGWTSEVRSGSVRSATVDRTLLVELAAAGTRGEAPALAGFEPVPGYTSDELALRAWWSSSGSHDSVSLEVWRAPWSPPPGDPVRVGSTQGVDLGDGTVMWQPHRGVVARLTASGVEGVAVASSMATLDDADWVARVHAAGLDAAPREQTTVAQHLLPDGRVWALAARTQGAGAPCLVMVLVGADGGMFSTSCERSQVQVAGILAVRVPSGIEEANLAVDRATGETELIDLASGERVAVVQLDAVHGVRPGSTAASSSG